MIKSFKHKGLQQLFEYDVSKLINSAQEQRIRTILRVLDGAERINDINLPGFGLHKLKGFKKERWSVKVSGNWRITFHYQNSDVFDVNMEDYH